VGEQPVTRSLAAGVVVETAVRIRVSSFRG
jgi:hypothetical protein